MALPDFSMRQLLEAGVHFGHQSHRWNPKMADYIFGARNNIHIIDLAQTVPMLHRALQAVSDTVAKGGRILFVGTKRQAADTVQREADRCGMPYVNDRWLGGSLTNYRTIRSRLTRLEELESIRAGEQINTYSKKMQSALSREYRKMFRNLNGMRTMTRLPECMVIIDPKKEKNAVLLNSGAASADATATLRALDACFGTGLTGEAMREIAHGGHAATAVARGPIDEKIRTELGALEGTETGSPTRRGNGDCCSTGPIVASSTVTRSCAYAATTSKSGCTLRFPEEAAGHDVPKILR